MKRHALLLLAGLLVVTGCQTWVREAGITAPSGHYPGHFPQYIPPSQPYPLPKELNSLEEAANNAYDNNPQR